MGVWNPLRDKVMYGALDRVEDVTAKPQEHILVIQTICRTVIYSGRANSSQVLVIIRRRNTTKLKNIMSPLNLNLTRYNCQCHLDLKAKL